MTTPRFRFQLGEEVTVAYPPSRRYPKGRRRNGTVERRSLTRPLLKERYAVEFTDGAADVLIPGYWIEARGQERMAA